jgi:hypothetical protein
MHVLLAKRLLLTGYSQWSVMLILYSKGAASACTGVVLHPLSRAAAS